MNEAILIIENDREPFYQLQKELSNFSCIPEDPSEYPQGLFKTYADIQKFTYGMIIKYHEQIKTIIIDISLITDIDTRGVDLIDYIRHCETFGFSEADEWRKSIPIICFTNHGTDDNIKKMAYEKGATNYFSKTTLDGTGELLLMKQNILFQKHAFNKTMRYSFNDIQVVLDILLMTSKSINTFLGEINTATFKSINDTIINLVETLADKSQLISKQIDGVSVLIKKESNKANEISKLLVIMNLIMLDPSKRDLFCENFANELLKTLKGKDYDVMDDVIAKEKKHILSSLLKTPSVLGLSFLNNVITFSHNLNAGISDDGLLQMISSSLTGLISA